jgi:hypothetical protein
MLLPRKASLTFSSISQSKSFVFNAMLVSKDEQFSKIVSEYGNLIMQSITK